MDLEFYTYDVHPRDRFDLWHDVACKSFVRHDCQPASKSNFDAEVQAAQFGSLSLLTYANTSMQVQRTSSQASVDEFGEMFCLVQRSGACQVNQDGREAVIEVGDFCVIDTTRAYDIGYPGFSAQIVLKIPLGALQSRLGPSSLYTARRVAKDSGIGAMVSGMLRALPLHFGELSEAARALLANQSLDLIALALGEQVGSTSGAQISSAAATTLQRVKLAVEESLRVRGVRCEDIAARAGVSVRYANELLSREGTSLERLLQQRRLLRCREALEVQGDTKRSISDIAYAWGFADPSHFARSFKAAYGVTPSAFRRRA